MTGRSRIHRLCLALTALLLTPLAAQADSHDCPKPDTSIFDKKAAQELFQNRKDPSRWVVDPFCEHNATFDVLDVDETSKPNQYFRLGANRGDTKWRYRAIDGRDALLNLADYLPEPLEEDYEPDTTAVMLYIVVEEYAETSAASVDLLTGYFTKPGATLEAFREASAAIDTLLEQSTVTVTCNTLMNRPKFKEPVCSSISGGFDLEGCQFNYDATAPFRRRGVVRVVWYTLGYGGKDDHARKSRRYECDLPEDRNELMSLFPDATAFKNLCHRRDYDIPYQTQPSRC